MDGMGALMAIAMLCQVSGANYTFKSRDAYQLKCQQDYIKCYEKKLDPTAQESWVGGLKDCVKERVVK